MATYLEKTYERMSKLFARKGTLSASACKQIISGALMMQPMLVDEACALAAAAGQTEVIESTTTQAQMYAKVNALMAARWEEIAGNLPEGSDEQGVAYDRAGKAALASENIVNTYAAYGIELVVG